MSSNLSHIRNFNAFIQLDLSKRNIAEEKAAKEDIARLSQDVIHLLQSSRQPADNTLIRRFIDTLTLADEQFNHAFSASLHTIHLLQELRENLPTSQQAIIHQEFILELETLNQSEKIPNPQEIAKKLYAFQKQFLLPAIENASSHEELLALKTVVIDCTKLKNKLALKEISALENLNKALESTLTLRILQKEPFYIKLLSIQKDTPLNLNDPNVRNKTHRDLKLIVSIILPSVSNPLLTTQEKEQLLRVFTLLNETYLGNNDPQITPLLEQLSKALPPPARPSPAPKQNTVLLQNLKSKIQELDAGSSKFKSQIADIQSELSKLKKNISGLDLTPLERLLTSLSQLESFKASTEEILCVGALTNKKMGAELINEYEKNQKIFANDVLSSSLKKLKQNANSFDDLLNCASATEKEIKSIFIEKRIRQFCEKYSPQRSLDQKFIENFIIVIKTTENLTKNFRDELTHKWKEISKEYDPVSHGKFFTLIAHYSWINPENNFDLYIEEARINFIKSLKLNSIDNQSLILSITEKAEAAQKKLLETFAQEYSEVFQKEHFWLLSNAKNIKQSYSQGVQTNTNLGGGVCFANSIQRMALIANNPTVPRTEIKMGSTEKSRFAQQTYRSKFGTAPKEATEGVFSYFGLKLNEQHLITPSTKETLYERLDQDLDSFAKKGHTQCLLAIKSENGSHSMNLEFDLKNKIFRIEDDNIGLIEFKTYKEFRQQLPEYLKAFYPEYTNLRLFFLPKK